MSHGSIQEHSGYWRDLWEMMFRYTSVWREKRPTWYVGLNESVNVFKKVVLKYGRAKERRALRVMVMLCCDERCGCGGEAFDIVGEGPTLKPVCWGCYLKENRDEVREAPNELAAHVCDDGQCGEDGVLQGVLPKRGKSKAGQVQSDDV